MTDQRLPIEIDPLRLASEGVTLEGTLGVENMPRLNALLADKTGKILISLDFRKDEGGSSIIRGKLSTTLKLTCQRCIEPANFVINGKFALSPITDESKLDTIPHGVEALVTQGQPVNVQTMIEDECLLLLPFVPMHSRDDCKVTLEPAAAVRKKNPFAALKEMIGENHGRSKKS